MAVVLTFQQPAAQKEQTREAIIKIVDGRPVECVNVDMLSADELDKYLVEAKGAKMVLCTHPECQTTAGCKCAERVRADQQEIMRINNSLRDTLLAIKALCAGDKILNWKDDWATTETRGQIMDLVDGVVR